MISTPGRLAAHLRDGSLTLKDSLAFLIVDEADYVLSYGYGEDVRAIASFLPEVCLCWCVLFVGGLVFGPPGGSRFRAPNTPFHLIVAPPLGPHPAPPFPDP